jgi:protein-disulfide isomerase
MIKSIRRAMFAALPLVLLPALSAQTPAPKDETITRQQADAILNELRQIRQLLEHQAANAAAPAQKPQGPTRAKLNLTGTNMLGSADAPLTMVEFTDYQCPFCQRFHTTVFNDLKKNFVDTGKVRFYSRDLPLDTHANAFRAAQAAHCAGDQGQFWTLRDLMGAHPDKLDLENLAGFASSLKMNVALFRSCIESDKYKNAVQTDTLEALKIGADGTPAFVIGRSTPEGVDGEITVGAMPYAFFEGKLKDLAAAK